MKMDWAVRCKGFVAICMPLCSRGSLHDARHSLNGEQIERYFVQIACALRYLHVRCAVHGDVKPANILLDESNNAILGDLGISRFLARGQDRVRSWSILGTRGFLAPEIQSDVIVDPFLTDAYALGATLWCLVFKPNPRNWEDLMTAMESDSTLLPRLGFHRFVLSRLVQNNPRLRLSVCDLLAFLRVRFERFRLLVMTSMLEITSVNVTDFSLYGKNAEGRGSSLKVLSDFTRQVFVVVNYCIICSLINVFGTWLLLNNLCCPQWLNICFNPLFQYSDIPFSSIDVQYLTAGWPHVCFTRISSWITAFITFERCLCIAIPLKVKQILTPRRTVALIVSIFLLLIATVSPVYYTSRLVWKFFPNRNKSLLVLSFTDDRKEIESVAFMINNVVVPVGAFLVVIVCTITLVLKLNEKAKWRKTSTAPGKTTEISSKEKRVVKMVSFISTIFISCFCPVTVVFFFMAREPEFSIDGQYRNIFFVVFSFCFILESINSSVNIFVYYNMSTKYKDTFNVLFRRKYVENKTGGGKRRLGDRY
ncbi:uncharacterized protein LOC101850033 [Aplysia californica]|uniref:Uncharacterized protein LOC101850033 n=1 Tax=Aplysia californica TaxID=6500 RepID=A0ABM1W068_APLCA|nr:uncharacterized protein LOC101850033 [Aplysia californica]